MTTFTKEQLVERARAVKDRLEWALAAVPGRKDAEMDLHLAEIALASLEAEPVAWDHEWASCITCEGPQNFKRVIEREAPPEWAIEEGQARNIIPLYRLPEIN